MTTPLMRTAEASRSFSRSMNSASLPSTSAIGWPLIVTVTSAAETMPSNSTFTSKGEALRIVARSSGYTVVAAAVKAEVSTVVAVKIRSEERRVGKSVSVRVDLGGRRIIKKKTTEKTMKTIQKNINSYSVLTTYKHYRISKTIK